MSKVTFEDFLMTQHANQYVGTKDCMVDDFPDWISDLSPDELIEYGDQFAKKQRALDYSKAIPHCEYDKDCCPGIFMLIKEGEVVCNECGMDLTRLIQTIKEGI